MRDRGERTTIPRLAEDAHDDLRLGFVDLDAVAGDGSVRVEDRHRVESVRDISRGEPSERATFEPAQRLVAQVVEIHVAHEALQREGHLRAERRRVDAVRDTHERHALELEALEDHRRVREVARRRSPDPC
ncbi:MAG: hypothetical protein M3680_34820 [Myxococcota bacterium]|nr:hypothetical protein [Myxococcota bacterium]